MANDFDGYRAGANLGGWISQYGEYDQDHFEEFIGEEDVERIASWGMDHVRLPVDYPVLADEETGEYSEGGFSYVDDCLSWCEEHGLNLIVDLHKAPGYSFNTLEENRLFDEESLQDRFVELWEKMAERYASYGDELAFELVNEVVEPTSDRWNALAHRTIDTIREIDPDRYVVYGGNNYNSVDELENIELVEGDDRVVYTFHFYKPFLFTHQFASWSDVTSAYDQEVRYPGEYPNLAGFLEDHPEYAEGYERFVGTEIDADLLERQLQPAVDFVAETGETVYCGEYGVIDDAPIESRINWYRDVVDFFNEHGIGRACWSYKRMNFGLVDRNGDVVSDEIVRIVSEN